MELCGALLVKYAIELIIKQVILWSNSTIALHWLRILPHLLKTYIIASYRANSRERISKRGDIRPKDNPVDALSRDQLSDAFLNNQIIWFTGSSWLTREENKWPKGMTELTEISERRKNTCLEIAVDDCNILRKYSRLIQN